MVTETEIEKQWQLERDALAQGATKIRKQEDKALAREYASSLVTSQSFMSRYLPAVCDTIERTVNDRIWNNAGAYYAEIATYLKDIEPLACAGIALKITFDKVFSNKPKANQVQSVTEAIGQAVENECMMRHYERKVPGLLHTLKENYFHRSIGTHQKVKVITTLMNRYDVPHWECWGRANRIKLGSWLIDCIIEASGWFTREMRQEGRKRHNYIIPSTHFLSIKEEVMATAELFSPLAWPMLIEPNDWTNERQGGYLLNEVMRGYDMVRRADPRCIQGETPINFLNKIQKVGYTLNPFIVGVAETLLERGIQVGKFIPIVELPLPPKPYDIAENKKARHDYNRKAAEVHNTNAQAFQRSCRTRMTMNAVKVFKDKEKFFIPWSFDYRGRAYPIPAFLTPQDTDFGKSLLKFYEQSFMTPEAEQWLAFQVATTYGKDKDTMSDRLDWVAKNHNLISRIAEDPISNRPEWEGAEEPWTFLAACDEYYHCVIKCDRTHTSLPVAVDATCSGLQILAGLSKDASTARMVNVIGSEKPQDAYAVIASHSMDAIPDRLKPHWDRKVTKRCVMTIPYNAKPFSNRSYIRDAFKEKEVDVTKEELTQCVQAVRTAMNEVVPGAMSVMKWIEQEIARTIKSGADEIRWTTPSGFIVKQRLMKTAKTRIESQLMGSVRISISGAEIGVDLKHHKNATAPNLIHSLDASLLHLATTSTNFPIALIHDSVLCRGTDMCKLSSLVRKTYMTLFAEHEPLTDFALAIGAEEKPPIIGDLKPEAVIDSQYFFC